MSAAGTLHRLTTADGSKHCTAVVLKTGQLLEVKNEFTGIRGAKFDSLEAWKAAREDQLTLSTNDSKTVANFKGFNVPTERVVAYRWLQWCYSIICELAPHLLENETLKAAYNTLAEVSTLYKDDLHTYNVYTSDVQRYNPENIKSIVTQYGDLISIGYPFKFKSHYHYRVPVDRIYNGSIIPEAHREPTKKIIDSYKEICEILKPAIGADLEKKYRIADLIRLIRIKERDIKVEEKKKERFLKRHEMKLYLLKRDLKNASDCLAAATEGVPQ